MDRAENKTYGFDKKEWGFDEKEQGAPAAVSRPCHSVAVILVLR
jgi:hypothetical protein